MCARCGAPLFRACEKGNTATVRLLLQRGSNLTGEFDFNNETSLSIAAFKLCWRVHSMLASEDLPGAGIIRAGAPYYRWEEFGTDKEKLSFVWRSKRFQSRSLCSRFPECLHNRPTCGSCRIDLRRMCSCMTKRASHASSLHACACPRRSICKWPRCRQQTIDGRNHYLPV